MLLVLSGPKTLDELKRLFQRAEAIYIGSTYTDRLTTRLGQHRGRFVGTMYHSRDVDFQQEAALLQLHRCIWGRTSVGNTHSSPNRDGSGNVYVIMGDFRPGSSSGSETGSSSGSETTGSSGSETSSSSSGSAARQQRTVRRNRLAAPMCNNCHERGRVQFTRRNCCYCRDCKCRSRGCPYLRIGTMYCARCRSGSR